MRWNHSLMALFQSGWRQHDDRSNHLFRPAAGHRGYRVCDRLVRVKYTYVAILRNPKKPDDPNAFVHERREIEAPSKADARARALSRPGVINIYQLKLIR